MIFNNDTGALVMPSQTKPSCVCAKPVTRLSFYVSEGHPLKKRDPVVIVLGRGTMEYNWPNEVQEVFGGLILLRWEMPEKPYPGAEIYKMSHQASKPPHFSIEIPVLGKLNELP